MAGILNEEERYADALDAAEKALDLDPRSAHAWIEAGVARAKLGKADAARELDRP